LNSGSPLRRYREIMTRRFGLHMVLVVAVLAGVLSTAPAGAIVDGHRARLTDHAWMVSLHDVDGHFCGGALLERDVVLTAAHCVEGYRADDIDVVVGAARVNPRRGGQWRSASEIVVHHRYFRADGYDIALIILNRPVRLGRRTQTIDRATRSEMRAANTATVAGWGAVSENGQALSRRLLETDLALVSDRSCNRSLAAEDEFIIPRRELCAGGDGADSCYGDSGGPLVIRGRNGEPKIVGIVSWGIECGGTTPGMYSEVPFFNTWINAQL